MICFSTFKKLGDFWAILKESSIAPNYFRETVIDSPDQKQFTNRLYPMTFFSSSETVKNNIQLKLETFDSLVGGSNV